MIEGGAVERTPTSPADEVLRLRDGRMLGYAEYGNPAGSPVMMFHGLPGSRLMASFADEAAARHGVRLIAPERPGYGLSTYQPGRRLLDWPDDVCELADAFGVERFAVAGVSSGGPYVAACAYKIPQRLTAAAMISSPAPYGTPAYFDGMHRRNRMTWKLTRRVPPVSRVLAWLTGRVIARASDERMLKMLSSDLPPADQAVVSRGELQPLLADTRESFRSGARGVAHEFGLNVRPWGFRLEDIGMPVHLWHGEDDRNVPVSHGRYLAGAIPNCVPHFCPAEGHLLVADHIDEILQSISNQRSTE